MLSRNVLVRYPNLKVVVPQLRLVPAVGVAENEIHPPDNGRAGLHATNRLGRQPAQRLKQTLAADKELAGYEEMFLWGNAEGLFK